MATILTKKSDTASSVPLTADLTNAAGGSELAVNTADKRLFTKTSGGTVVELGTNPSSMTLPNGTTNGVPYLNGSKVLTTGSALTFDGAGNLTSTGAAGSGGGELALKLVDSTSGRLIQMLRTGATFSYAGIGGAEAALYTASNNLNLVADGGAIKFNVGTLGAASEQMRITSTGLGIGTSSPNARLDVTQLTSDITNGMTLRGYTTGSDGARTFNINTVSSDLNNWANLNFKAQQFTFSIQGTEKARIDSSGNLGLGVTPDASAILDAQSTTKGVRLPNMTTTQKNAISSPAAGLLVFDTALAKLCVYTGASWQTITSI